MRLLANYWHISTKIRHNVSIMCRKSHCYIHFAQRDIRMLFFFFNNSFWLPYIASLIPNSRKSVFVDFTEGKNSLGVKFKRSGPVFGNFTEKGSKQLYCSVPNKKIGCLKLDPRRGIAFSQLLYHQLRKRKKNLNSRCQRCFFFSVFIIYSVARLDFPKIHFFNFFYGFFHGKEGGWIKNWKTYNKLNFFKNYISLF